MLIQIRSLSKSGGGSTLDQTPTATQYQRSSYNNEETIQSSVSQLNSKSGTEIIYTSSQSQDILPTATYININFHPFGSQPLMIF